MTFDPKWVAGKDDIHINPASFLFSGVEQVPTIFTSDGLSIHRLPPCRQYFLFRKPGCPPSVPVLAVSFFTPVQCKLRKQRRKLKAYGLGGIKPTCACLSAQKRIVGRGRINQCGAQRHHVAQRFMRVYNAIRRTESFLAGLWVRKH